MIGLRAMRGNVTSLARGSLRLWRVCVGPTKGAGWYSTLMPVPWPASGCYLVRVLGAHRQDGRLEPSDLLGHLSHRDLELDQLGQEPWHGSALQLRSELERYLDGGKVQEVQ